MSYNIKNHSISLPSIRGGVSRLWRRGGGAVGYGAFLFLLSLPLSAHTIEGRVVAEGKPQRDVVVTDGQNFAYTDANGHYTIDAPDDARFVYLLTPKGYVCNYASGIPQFYQQLKSGQSRYNFELLPMKGDADKTLVIAGADTQLDTDHDRKRLFDETVSDMKQLLNVAGY